MSGHPTRTYSATLSVPPSSRTVPRRGGRPALPALPGLRDLECNLGRGASKTTAMAIDTDSKIVLVAGRRSPGTPRLGGSSSAASGRGGGHRRLSGARLCTSKGIHRQSARARRPEAARAGSRAYGKSMRFIEPPIDQITPMSKEMGDMFRRLNESGERRAESGCRADTPSLRAPHPSSSPSRRGSPRRASASSTRRNSDRLPQQARRRPRGDAAAQVTLRRRRRGDETIRRSFGGGAGRDARVHVQERQLDATYSVSQGAQNHI